MMGPLSGNLSAFTSLSRHLPEIRADLERAAHETVTGRRQDLSLTLGGRAGEFALIEKGLADLETNTSRLGLTEGRLRQTGLVLTSVRDAFAPMTERALTDLSLNEPAARTETAAAARATLDQVISLLNTNESGRHLFAGDETEGPALADAETLLTAAQAALTGATTIADQEAAFDAFFNGAGFDTLVYQGGPGQAAAAALGDGSAVRFEAKADAQPVRDLLNGLARLALAPGLPEGGAAWAGTAAEKLAAANDGMILMQSVNGVAEGRVSRALEAQGQERLVLTATQQSLAGVDTVEAASRVKSLELQLEAAYAMTARLSRLNFADYIR
ncbi:flagellin [Parvularcula oceani]|uniref:flagellin n=1 Tax=Parvularcula oceani TaxID=1247963 RepID=UPI0004E255AA|nr:flagellin [Parvularcula oceani]